MHPLRAIARQIDDLPRAVTADGHAGQERLQRFVGDVRQHIATPQEANRLLFLTRRHMSHF